MISAWSTSLAVEHAVSNIQVRKIIDRFRYRWNNYKAESGDMENVKKFFLPSRFLDGDHKGFPEGVEVRLIDKTQGSDPTKGEHYWITTLKTLYPDGLNIDSDY